MIYYFGSFPPPYGGVTVKNNLLFSKLEEKLKRNLVKVDTLRAKKNPVQLLKQGLLLLHRKDVFVVATAGRQRRYITLFLYYANRRALRRSTLVVMGGHFAERIQADAAYIRALSQYREILVETNGMIRELEQLGLGNVLKYPNCRCRPSRPFQVSDRNMQPLQCVFFSLISREKGADKVLAAAKQYPNAQLSFYGELKDDYAEEFLKEIAECPNAVYCGVFQVDGENVYKKLNEYDVLLLPTSWPHEGVPGVLVEAKIAAVPAVVSNVCYNSEIIEDGVSGMVLKENTVEDLVKAISCYDTDRQLLKSHKDGALRSAEQYYAENYVEGISERFT